MRDFTQYNADMQKYANALYDMNELDRQRVAFLKSVDYDLYNPTEYLDRVIGTPKDDELRELRKRQKDNDIRFNQALDYLISKGYSGYQLPSRTDFDNYIDWREPFRRRGYAKSGIKEAIMKEIVCTPFGELCFFTMADDKQALYNHEIMDNLGITKEAFEAALGRVPDAWYRLYPGDNGTQFIQMNSLEVAEQVLVELKKVAGILKVYELDCTWQYFGTLSYLSEGYDNAVSKALGPDTGLPSNGEYVNDSFAIEKQTEEHVLKCDGCGCEKTVPEYIATEWCNQCGSKMSYNRSAE